MTTAFVLLVENILCPFAGLAILTKFLLSPRRTALKTLLAEMPERLGRPAAADISRFGGRPPVWIHCASAGEVNAAAALIARLKKRGLAVAVTTTTHAGRERAKAVSGVDAAWVAPLDCGPAVGAFLNRVKPALLIVVETELWPQMIELTARRGIPCALVNARMTEKSYGRYQLARGLVRPFLRRFALIAAQTEPDAARFKRLGADDDIVIRAGNMKHDLPGAGAVSPPVRAAFLDLDWGDGPVFTAGSTHPVEEDAVIEAFLAAKRREPRLKLVIAPRHVERAGDCAKTLEARGISSCRWSARRPGVEALLVDSLGVLSQLYSLATVAFVGGTLVPVGGHNLLEPALAGRPVLFGPHVAHAQEAARLLESAGGGSCAADGSRLAALLEDLLADPARAQGVGAIARKAAQGMQGAVDRTEKALAPLLP